jgi:hypothetical protein
VKFREGVMAYGPAPSAGEPGQLLLDPDCSYGALVHEMRHLRDDQAAGWRGIRASFEDPYQRYEGEVRAYGEEISYAESIGDHDSARQLRRNLEDERKAIFGEGP